MNNIVLSIYIATFVEKIEMISKICSLLNEYNIFKHLHYNIHRLNRNDLMSFR